ncbi:PEPxxWA-CTERM sorting domain-containing protein [Sandaracinobacteroides hominis]|uniref:PEPxxWA-CTERM sorting domain-containing protein n=1 Tax=Sandaracinobacteroides hominis TaxID=2780086 RepID=UPI0018F2A5C8|nr:PEPxxWA-CTERM sorting domain-containing protein [Sandaracinobacteroides hominis]
MSRLILVAAVAAAFAAPATAAVITPVAVTASDTFNDFYPVANLINGSGMSGKLHDGQFNNMWQSTWDQIPHWLVFDLGQTVHLTSTSIWNYNQDFGWGTSLGRGVKDLEISISMDGVGFTSILTTELRRGTGLPIPAEVVALSGTARYVKFDLLSNQDRDLPTNEAQPWTGLSEVRFAGAVPEAATWAMMIMGFGMVGSAMRRRRMIAA